MKIDHQKIKEAVRATLELTAKADRQRLRRAIRLATKKVGEEKHWEWPHHVAIAARINELVCNSLYPKQKRKLVK
jgi:hypothetical protein